VKSPSDSQDEIYDDEDDLAAPLVPLSKEYVVSFYVSTVTKRDALQVHS
jgi:hypothetical protein